MQRHSHRLTDAEEAQVLELLRRDAPQLEALARRGMMALRYEQPWFRRHRLFQVDLPAVMPPRHLQVALPEDDDGTARLLTAHIDHLNALVDADPPTRLASLEEAHHYGEAADQWTSESALGELVIGSFDEIPLYPDLDEVEQASVGVLREELTTFIEPPAVERTPEGFVLVKWVVANQRLLRREVHIEPDGHVRREEVVYDESLPCPPGKVWAERNGRTVPVG